MKTFFVLLAFFSTLSYADTVKHQNCELFIHPENLKVLQDKTGFQDDVTPILEEKGYAVRFYKGSVAGEQVASSGDISESILSAEFEAEIPNKKQIAVLYRLVRHKKWSSGFPYLSEVIRGEQIRAKKRFLQKTSKFRKEAGEEIILLIPRCERE